MSYISFGYGLFVCLLLILYYILPVKCRWTVLLAGSLGFYYWIARESFWLFLASGTAGYVWGRVLPLRHRAQADKSAEKGIADRVCLFAAVVMMLFPFIAVKCGSFVSEGWGRAGTVSLFVPLGISFYTLQMISYLVDIYLGKAEPQRNFFKYMLFVSFFPQIVQGPIPRYGQLDGQLYEGHLFDEREFCKGLQLVVWGVFMKLVIADRAGIIVDTVYNNFPEYQGGYILAAGVLYSLQLYTDFLSCVTISQGVSALFGIRLTDNFRQPYRAVSVRDFWRRWHISLSTWLRDYIYIPLGGSRKGKRAKYRNLVITFVVSGFWHGAGGQFIIWGLLHGVYQIAGELVSPFRQKVYAALYITVHGGERLKASLQRLGTFFWVMLAWILFRAESLKTGIAMLTSLFTTYNPWIFFDDSLLELGLTWKGWGILFAAVLALYHVERRQERLCIRDWILEQHLIVRWGIYLSAILSICILGVYGFGFNGQDFIYGGF